MLSFGLTTSAQQCSHDTERGYQLPNHSNLHCDLLERVLSLCRLLPYLGVVTVGIGDAMAAIIGSKYGRHRWVLACVENKRTVEGTLAGCVSMYLCAGNSDKCSDSKKMLHFIY